MRHNIEQTNSINYYENQISNRILISKSIVF